MDAAQLSNLLISGSVATSTLRDNVFAELEMNENPDWGYLLKHMTMAFKQLETMKSDIPPGFQLVDVAPLDSSVREIPHMLGTFVSPEDMPSLDVGSDSAIRLHVDSEAIKSHNTIIQDLLEAIAPSEQDTVKRRR